MRFFLPNKKEKKIFYPIFTLYNIIYNMALSKKNGIPLYKFFSSLSYKFIRVAKLIKKIGIHTKRSNKNSLFLYNKFLVEVLSEPLTEVYKNNAILTFDNVVIKKEKINVNADYFEGRNYMKILQKRIIKGFFDKTKYKNRNFKIVRIKAISKDNKINTNIFLHGKGK